MIVYKSNKAVFLEKIDSKQIADAVKIEYEKRIGKVNNHEYLSWKNSLRAISRAVRTPLIDDDVTICIEFKIPTQNKRIDFIIAGKDDSGCDNVVIVELKQWNDADAVSDKNLVSTLINGKQVEVVHPSYQAWSYAVTLQEYNETIQNENILLFPCAYLHNYVPVKNDIILDRTKYREIEISPIFTNDDVRELEKFITDHVRHADSDDIMRRIDYGKIRPSKSLQDVLASMLKGNREFILIDEQKEVFENIMSVIYRMRNESKGKTVFIVKGGPGTGKSVIAINLLSAIIQDGKSVAYVSKNTAPRNVYQCKLAMNGYRRGYIESLFLGSGSFINSASDSYDVLIVDEAHRLNRKSGYHSTQGENQIKEILNAARTSIFFIDEQQRITAKDIGSIKEIKQNAKSFSAEIKEMELLSQFRCNGSDGYLDFLDDVLDIEQKYYTFNCNEYDIQVFDDPAMMMQKIEDLNRIDNKARLLAGYCWPWISKRDSRKQDIEIPEYNFAAQWNYNKTKTWAIDKESVKQIGCIHTSQGLEFTYVGVIIGNDLRYENGKVITDYTERAKTDKSLDGLKTACKKNDQSALKKADEIIRDTYKTLLSRGMKGCYIFCMDKALANHIRSSIRKNNELFENFTKINKVADIHA